MNLFWNRSGEPIEDVTKWAKMFEDSEYRIVSVDQDGDAHPPVSVVIAREVIVGDWRNVSEVEGA